MSKFLTLKNMTDSPIVVNIDHIMYVEKRSDPETFEELDGIVLYLRDNVIIEVQDEVFELELDL